MSDGLAIILYLVFGLAFLWGGAEGLIRGGASFALRLGIPTMIIGLTVIGYGSGTPELIVSLQAGLIGKGDIALGNVIGSNIANSALILGVAAMICPIPINRQFLVYDIPIMIVVSVTLCIVLVVTRFIGAAIGFSFLVGIIFYSYCTIKQGLKNSVLIAMEQEEVHHLKLSCWWLEILLIALGLFALIFGGSLFLTGSIQLAKLLNVSDAVIAVTVVAFGTSLPELAITIIAVIRKHTDFVMGNIVGSNIFNILAIVGLTAAIQPIEVSDISLLDYTSMMGLALLIWIFGWSKRRVSRIEGGILCILYMLFLGYYSFKVI